MSQFYTGKNKKFGNEITCQKFIKLLNKIINQNGILIDCFLPNCRSIKYPTGISKPLPLLKAVDYKKDIILVMLEYQLYLPKDDSDERKQIGLKLRKRDFDFYKNDELVYLFYKENRRIELDLSNFFEFDYQLKENISIPIIDFWNWAKTPFI